MVQSVCLDIDASRFYEASKVKGHDGYGHFDSFGHFGLKIRSLCLRNHTHTRTHTHTHAHTHTHMHTHAYRQSHAHINRCMHYPRHTQTRRHVHKCINRNLILCNTNVHSIPLRSLFIFSIDLIELVWT